MPKMEVVEDVAMAVFIVNDKNVGAVAMGCGVRPL
jgi:hypothetical protein